ncbi:MAG: DnaD domain protein [Tenericutes bacterium]|nr:DnaD domain protein [Mycoplasmatota bacterium]
MKEIVILPADTYTVVNKTVIKDLDRKLITMLYQPIIGYSATSLYFTLVDDLDKRELMSEDLTHHHLMSTMQLKLDDIVIARKKLEAVGLLKTYYKKDHVNHYVYLLYSPMSASDFLNHPVLNIVLYNNLGKKEYDRIVEFFKVPKISTKDYEDITASFSDVFKSVSGNVLIENENIRKENTNKIDLNSKIDFNLLISSIPTNMVSPRCFNDETKDLINSLAFTYDIDDINMQGLVRNSINERGLIDKIELRKNCRNFYQFENDGKLPTFVYSKQPDYLKTPAGDNSKWAKMVYTFESVHPYDFLRSKYKTGEPSLRDLKLIESLLVDQKMTPGVVNVLIAYVLKINNQKLSKNYIDTIAGQWKRLNIETVEEAMRISEKEHKKLKKQFENKNTSKTPTVITKNKKQEELPDWFNKDLKNEEMTEDDMKELDNILNSIDQSISNIPSK